MRTGHVGGRPGPVHSGGPILVPVLRPIRHVARDRRRRRRCGHEDLPVVHDAHQIAGRVGIAFLARPLVRARAEACLEEQLVGHRRGPLHLLDALRVEVAKAVRFGRGRRRRRSAERRRPRALAADRLLIPDERKSASLRCLPRDARCVVLPRAIRERRIVVITHPGPRVRIACVLVVIQVQRVLSLPLPADAHVVPELVLDDRPTDCRIEVVDVIRGVRLENAARCQLWIVVARLHSLREPRVEQHARHRVAALPRDDVDGETGRLLFAETSRRGHRHFRCVADVGDVVRRLVAAGRVADIEAVHRQTRFDAAAAVDREDREHRTGVDVVVVGLQARHRVDQVAVAARARESSNGFVVECDLASRARDVDDRCFTRHRDRLLHAADTHLTVHVRDGRAADDDAFLLHGCEARQRERHGICPGSEILDAVTSVPVADRRANLFNQDRAGGFHRHTW